MHIHNSIELLEARIAPAVLVSPTTVTFQDIDGDNITVKVSKPIFTNANVATFFSFAGSNFTDSGPQALSTLSLTTLPDTANGLGVTITAKRSPTAGGSGDVHIFGLNASDVNATTGTGAGIDLGVVSIQGDVTYIDAGDGDAFTPAVKSITVNSIGSQQDGIESDIVGAIGSLKVRGNMQGWINVQGIGSTIGGSIGTVSIGGSLGSYDSANGGRLQADAGFGTITIKGNVFGGDADDTGAITSPNSIKTLTVGGSILGGDGAESGRVSALYIGTLKIGGSIVGGDGADSGKVRGYSSGFGTVTVGGDLIGGQGDGSGRIEAGANTGSPGSIKSLLIKGSVIGRPLTSGNGALGAGIYANGDITSLTINGDFIAANIIAGVAAGDGEFGNAGDVNDTTGGASTISKIAKLIIKGNVRGTSSGGDSFGIEANSILSVKIGTAPYLKSNPALNFGVGFFVAPTNDVIVREVG